MYLNRNFARKLFKTTRASETFNFDELLMKNVIYDAENKTFNVFFFENEFFLAGSAYNHIGNGVKNCPNRDSNPSKLHQTLRALSYGPNLEFSTC